VKDPAKAKYSEDLFQKEALTFIRKNKNKPFFLYYATQLPHGPCITPDLGVHKDKPWSQKHKEWAAMIEHMDRGVGKMVAQLDESGVLENTIIFFAGDNGYSQWGYFGRAAHEDDPLFKNKGPWPKGKFTCTHEGGMRVPFFAYWKGKIKAQESSHICALYDILATTADLAGTASPETDGISLVPTLLAKPDKQLKHKYLYWENGTRSPHAQSVRMDQWWAYRDHPSKPIELYDITKDIDCKKNLAKDNPNIAAKIEQILKEAHVDSQWYVNPGQSKAQIDAKRQKAKAAGQMQTPVKANTIFRGRAE
jgi:arylsulfatase A-like enzyme